MIDVTETDLADALAAVPATQRSTCVTQVNAWLSLNVRRPPTGAPLPAAIISAARALVPDAVANKLFVDTEQVLASMTVSATSGTSVSETYVQGSHGKARTAGENLALALIAPWRRLGSRVTRIERT